MRAGDILGGRYELEHEIGKGGMGVVWAAYDRDREQRVAIKLILGGSDDPMSEDLRNRLKREALVCMKLDHPNVVRVYDFQETAQHDPYVVMELLEGKSLQEKLLQQRRLEPKLAARICADVATALAAVHEAKIIHRDLKPANIYLHREPGMTEDEFTTKVLDFGICKEPDAADVGKTKTGLLVGSAAYMSPEQIIRPKEIDGRVDIWALGMVLHELLTGTRTFTGTLESVIAQLITLSAPSNKKPAVQPPSSMVRNVPPELDAIVARCTALQTRDRYANADEIARELYAIAGVRAPSRQSTSRRSVAEALNLPSTFDAPILESNAPPIAQSEPKFKPMSKTLPLVPSAKAVASLPQVEDDGDGALTLPMLNRKIAQSSRPLILEETSPPRDAASTQLLVPNTPVPSPEPEWKKVLAEHREISRTFSIPDQLQASNGETKALDLKTLPLTPSPSERSATTSGIGALAQEITDTIPQTPPAEVAAAKRRPRTSKGMLYFAGGFLFVAASVMVAVVVHDKAPTVTPPGPPPITANELASAVPPLPSSSPPPVAPVPTVSAILSATTSAAPEPPPAPSASVAPVASVEPSASAVVKASMTTIPVPVKKGKRTVKKCSGVGVFYHCTTVEVP